MVARIEDPFVNGVFERVCLGLEIEVLPIETCWLIQRREFLLATDNLVLVFSSFKNAVDYIRLKEIKDIVIPSWCWEDFVNKCRFSFRGAIIDADASHIILFR